MAVRSERIRQSKQNPNYWKYEIDIEEVDGSITKRVPQYGIDMVDALNGVLLKEKWDSFMKGITKTPDWVFAIAFIFLFGGGFAVLSQFGLDMEYVISAFGAILFFGAAFFLIDKFINKRSIEENE